MKYKLTDKNDQTYGGCQWGKDVTHTADGKGELCTRHWIHYYDDPILALLMNPAHANFKQPHLWGCEIEEPTKHDHGLKSGTVKLTTIKRLRKKRITKEQFVKFGILCVKQRYSDRKWNKWADNWLNGTDRSARSAIAAANAAYTANATATVVAHTANAAVNTAVYAANAVANAAAHAANAAAYVASNAAYAANATAYAAGADIDLVAIAHEAIE